jgi:predicted PurR-regulated permease PerM
MAATHLKTRSTFFDPVMATVLVVGILYLAKSVFIPITLAILITFVLSPVVTGIQRYRVGRVPAVLLAALLMFILVGGVGWIVGSQVKDLAADLPTHRKEIDAKIVSLRREGSGVFPRLWQMIHEISKGETEDGKSKQQQGQPATVVIQASEQSSVEQVLGAAGSILEPLAQAGLVVVLVFFMLIKREDLRNRVIGLLGHGHLTGTTRVFVDSAKRLSRLLLTQLMINLGYGVLFAVGLLIAGVPYAFLWGFMLAVLRFIPYVGSFLAASFPFLLSFAISPGWAQPIAVVVIFAVLELVTANVIEPLLFGRGTGVSPIALLVAAAFWTWIWGPIGLVLSTPMTVCLVVLGQHVPRLRFLSLLLGNEPALEPHVVFYQRLLAHDQEEAEQVATRQVELHGEDHVYDRVFLPALALARRDRERSGLSAEDEAYIFQSTKEVMDHVAAEASKAVAPSVAAADAAETPKASEVMPATQPVVILACPAHHDAEELTLTMLARLLAKDCCRVDEVTTNVLPSEIEARIEKENPELVFIAILPPGGFMHARYLCNRLRKRFPNLRIVVGCWGEDRHFDEFRVRIRDAGANEVTTSLLETRTKILGLLNHILATPPRPITPTLETSAPA